MTRQLDLFAQPLDPRRLPQWLRRAELELLTRPRTPRWMRGVL